MDSESVRRRGIQVFETERAVLHGYRLAFDLGVDLLSQEPRMANLRAAPDQGVHGVAHRISEADLVRLDAMEFTYERVQVELSFYDGRTGRGSTYVNTDPAFTRPEAPPSERYLRILQRGAHEHDLAPEFQAWLAAHPAHVMPPDPGLPDAITGMRVPPTFTLADVQRPGPDGRPHLAAFGGFVFDLSGTSNPLADVYFIGRDATAFLVGRTLDLPPPRTPEDLHPRHRAWLNHALHDLCRVGRVVGVIEGGLAGSLANGSRWEPAG